MQCDVNRGSGGSAKGPCQLKDIKKEAHELPAPDAQPEYHNVTATVALIEPDQALYYAACPANNRKVSRHESFLVDKEGKSVQ